MIEIAIMGHGVVGSGVATIIRTHKKRLFKNVGEEIYIKKILDLREFPDSPLADRFTKDFEEIINDVEIRVVAEVMGGINPAYDYTKRLLKAGKSVVTSNKELVAAKGAELLEIARENNVNYLFEASVGGGIPIIRPMNQCLVANDVSEISGILNGTTNFILTKMFDDGMDFDSALKLAQELGYAERNPAADIEGHDACRKICILASLATGKHVYPENIYTEGITRITNRDVLYAEKAGCVIKLIGNAKLLDNGKLDIYVAPMLIGKDGPLANIKGVFNGILVNGDCTDEVMFYGKGAGSMPTASAVVADIIDSCHHLKQRRFLFWADSNNENILPHNESRTAVYLRINTTDALGMVKDLFGDVEVIIEADELAVITKEFTVEEIYAKMDALAESGYEVLSSIRVESK